MVSTGDKPGKGTYQCVNCGELMIVRNPNDTLPPCSRCSNTQFEEVHKEPAGKE